MISWLEVLLLIFSDTYSASIPYQLRYEGRKPLSQVSLKIPTDNINNLGERQREAYIIEFQITLKQMAAFK